jgi:phage replication O-like protein O
MKIPAPNHTQSPNVFFDEIFKTLTEGELRIILVVIRQTFGWHKAYDRISLAQLAEKSGMQRRSACRSLVSLIEKGLVCKKKFGPPGKEKCYYSLVVESCQSQTLEEDDGYESEEEMEIISKSLYQCPKDTTPVTERHYPSDLKTPTKETNTKETIQKKQQQAKPVTAAVPSKSLNKEKPSIYPILDIVNILKTDKEEITQKYSIEDVTHAVKWALHPETKLNKGLVQAIKWACKNKPAIPEAKVDKELVNKNYAMKYDKMKNGSIHIVACNKYVEIVTGGQGNTNCFNYDMKGFYDQFTNALRKYNFKILEG